MDQINSLRTENKFKKTEIGEIPVDWEIIRLDEVCEVVGGSTPSTKNKEYWDGSIPWAVPTDITRLKGNIIYQTQRYITEKGLSSISAKPLPVGSILLTSRATIGECAINAKPIVTNQGFASLICKDIVYNWYIFYLMIYLRENLKNLSAGSTFREISKKTIRSIRIPLPPLPEQINIAKILSLVDEAIENKKSIIEKTKELKKGLMQELLTRGIGHTKFKKTELGKIPEDWNVVRIKDICEIVGGSTPSTNIEEYWNGDIPWAVPTDITKLKDNVILDTEKNISNKGLSNSAAKLLPVGSILLTSRATIGELAINLKPMATNQGFANFKCRTEIYNWYLFYRLILIKKELKRLASGSTFKEISKNSIRAIKIPLPPLEEQMTIGDILLSLDEVIKQETKNTEYFKNVKKGVMAVLLTGKIRVKYF